MHNFIFMWENDCKYADLSENELVRRTFFKLERF